MRPLPPAIAIAVLTLSVEWIAQQAHGPVWFAVFTAGAMFSAAYLVHQRQTVGAVITAVTDIIEDHAGPQYLLNQNRAFLVKRLADVEQAKPGTPDLGAVTSTVELVSQHLDTRLADAGVDLLPPFDAPVNRNDFDAARRMIQARLDDVDAALARLAGS